MRVLQEQGDFKARAIAGTHHVMIALNCTEERRRGLMGFAFQRETVDTPYPSSKWLRSHKVFGSVVPRPLDERDPYATTQRRRYSTQDHPVQSFLWGDDTAQPGTKYRYTVIPMYGRPGALEPGPALQFDIQTEKELDRGHGIWFNRGAISSEAFTEEFQNKAPGNPNDPQNRETSWLSRGLLEACLRYINETPAGDGLRVATCEFTYRPILDALNNALQRGVNVRIIYHDTTHETGVTRGENETAIANALPTTFNNTQVVFARTKTKVPHNSFLIRLQGGSTPVSVWTGSTQFTQSGFLGQLNVGHLVEDSQTAKQYLSYWELLKTDPDLEGARNGVMAFNPDPQELIAANSIVPAFSPRPRTELLNWTGRRIADAEQSVMFTAAFGVSDQLVPALANAKGSLRFLLMEKPPSEAVKSKLAQNQGLRISSSAELSEMYDFKGTEPVARRKMKEYDLEKWFLKAEASRKADEGYCFFVHARFLLIDPLSDDPLVCSGSANFSSHALLQNDENMLLIRGDTRVADIYLTEFDRIFRQFYFRDVANDVSARGDRADTVFLEETDRWTNGYFQPGEFKTRRRPMFFLTPSRTWAQNAAERPEPVKPVSRPAPAKASAKSSRPPSTSAKPSTSAGPSGGKATAKKVTVKKSASQPSKKAAATVSVKKSLAKKPLPAKSAGTTGAKKGGQKTELKKPVTLKKGTAAKATLKKAVAKQSPAKKVIAKTVKKAAPKTALAKKATGKVALKKPAKVAKPAAVKKATAKSAKKSGRR